MTSEARATRGAYAKTAGRRREILGAAVEVFSGSGYRKGSLRDVADKVGLSQAGLLHHFPNKGELLEAVLEWRDDHTRQQMGDPMPQGLAFLRAMADAAQANAATPGLVELHVVLSAEATAPDHPVHAYFVQRYREVVRLTEQAFRLSQERGQVQPHVDCASAARSLVAVMDGLQVQWLLDRDLDMAAEVRQFLRPLLTVAA